MVLKENIIEKPGVSPLTHVRRDILRIHPRYFISSALHILAMSIPHVGLRIWLYRLRGTKIGKNVFIGPKVFFEEIYPELITIQDHCSIGPRVGIVTHHTIFQHVDPASHSFTAPVVIGTNCYIGANALILPGVVIGEDSIIAAGSVITKSIPPGSVVMGIPGKVICSRDEWIRDHMTGVQDTHP